MDFLPQEIAAYAAAHTSPESEVLARLNRETHAKVLSPRMLSGHVQGRALALFSRMIRPTFVLEIGTYTGYSAICLAEGLQPGGKVITLDVNDELETFTRSFFAASGYANRIEYCLGDAADLIPTRTESFDLVFIDADKRNYRRYYDLVFDRVRPGGFILADNVLWSGKVVARDPVQTDRKIDADTQALLDFNRFVHDDPRVENLLLPLRDGLLIIRKKEPHELSPPA
jgi:predicted O-methyltransferase YrrM